MLNKIIGAIFSNFLGSGQRGKQTQAMQLIQNLIQSQGGVEKIINQFQQGGLDDVLQSWLGNGSNKPVSPQQIQNSLGSDTLHQVSQQAGVKDTNLASQMLAEYLPKVIDKISRDGQVDTQSANNLLSGDIQSLLKSLLK